MLSEAIWWVSNVLEAIVLFRACKEGLLRRYPFFYFYIATVFVTSVPLAILYSIDRPREHALYGPANYLTIFLGCGILLEILRHVLSHYPGASRFGKAICTTAVCVILVFVAVYRLVEGSGSIATDYWNTERNLRAVQAVLLFTIFFAIAIYRIPFGKNMRGMVVGYGIYIGTSLVTLAIALYARRFERAWLILQPFSYDVSLTIWCASLWSYHPAPTPEKMLQDSDYEALANTTRRALGSVRSHLGRSVR